MNREQIEAIAELTGSSLNSKAGRAALLVILNGVSHTEAAEKAGCTRSTVHDAVNKYRRVHEKLKKIYTT